MDVPVLYSIWIVLILFISSMHAMELSKSHHSDKETKVKIPSSLCGSELHPLGMESGEITDQQITASSSYNLQSVGPQNARLNREISGGAWCPSKQLNAASSGTEWIQVDLIDYYVITAVASQGRFGNGMGVEYAEEYWLEYSRDNGTTWTKWTDANGDYKLPGNHDTYSPHKNILSHPLVGIRLLRIVPFANYQRTTCLRFELYGCKQGHILPVFYSMPDGFKGSSLGDLRDLTYDGRHDFYGYLTGGLGQLTDGIKGDDNYKVNYGYEWIGWRAEPGTDLTLIFKFDQIVNFTSAVFYTHNLFSKDIQVFSSAKVWFSYDGNVWSKRPIEFEYMPDLMLENPRDVVVHLHQRAGSFIKFDLEFASKWILISEVTFNTIPVNENFTIAYEHLESPFDALLPISTAINGERAFLPQTTFLVLFVVLGTVLCSIVLFLLRLHLRRKEKAGHIVVCMKDLATTPLYCEPKDFSSTSSTISNTVTDPEYAVPDVAMPNMIGTAIRLNDTSSNGGHLNNNLSMFGFTRIFMGGNAKLNKTTGPIPISGNMALGKTATLNNVTTSNVAYTSQKFPYLAEAGVVKTTNSNGSSYTVSKPSTINSNHCANSIPNELPSGNVRQHYASTDLISKSIKKGNLSNGLPKGSIETVATCNPMTSNTIYNKRKFAGVNEDVMTTNGNTLKLKFSGYGVSSLSESIDEMKCIPEVSEKDIELIGKQLGHSRFGQVLAARWRDPKLASANRKPLARNQVSGDLPSEAETGKETGNGLDKATAEGANESLVILKTLDKEKLRGEFLHEMKSKWFISAKSERVAKLIGYISTPRHMAMVLECGNSDLSHFLPNCDKKSIGIDVLLHIGGEVAAGMKYLESLGYVHRDLSARNCIIYTNTLQVKITDTAELFPSNAPDYFNGVALRWAAPEALVNGVFSSKSDVYSFGVTLWEILTYCMLKPNHELENEQFLQKVFSAYESYFNECANECSNSSIYYQATYGVGSSGGSSEYSSRDEYACKPQSAGATRVSYRLALARPTTCPPEIYDLLLECWQLNEHTRPSFRDITQFLVSRGKLNAEQVQVYA